MMEASCGFLFAHDQNAARLSGRKVQWRPFFFRRETKGLPEALLQANIDNCIAIPMHGTRSLNLATAVAVVLFEAVRQQR